MTRARRAVLATLLLASFAGTTGCVGAGWGTYPVASGEGVEAFDLASARVHTPEISADVTVRTYQPTMMFFGILIPVIPFPPVPGLGTAERLEITVQTTGGSEDAFVQPESLRVLIDSHEYAATSIEIINWPEADVPPNKPVPARDGGLIVYDFKYLDSPRVPFSIVVDGLPRIDFVPKRRMIGGVAGP